MIRLALPATAPSTIPSSVGSSAIAPLSTPRYVERTVPRAVIVEESRTKTEDYAGPHPASNRAQSAGRPYAMNTSRSKVEDAGQNQSIDELVTKIIANLAQQPTITGEMIRMGLEQT